MDLSKLKLYEVGVMVRRVGLTVAIVGGGLLCKKFYGVEVSDYAEVWNSIKPVDDFVKPIGLAVATAFGVDLNEFRVFMRQVGVL